MWDIFQSLYFQGGGDNFLITNKNLINKTRFHNLIIKNDKDFLYIEKAIFQTFTRL